MKSLTVSHFIVCFTLQFLKKHDDKFDYDTGSKWVSLKVDGGDYSDSDTAVKHHGKAEETKEELNERTKRLVLTNSYWLFCDCRGSCLDGKALQIYISEVVFCVLKLAAPENKVKSKRNRFVI